MFMNTTKHSNDVQNVFVKYFVILLPIPYKLKQKINSQISKQESKPVFIGSCTSEVSANSGYYASLLGFHFFREKQLGILLKRRKF